MDNEVPQQNGLIPNNQNEPATNLDLSSAGSGNNRKIIQPLDPNLKVDSVPIQPRAQPVATISVNSQGQTTDAAIKPSDVTVQPQQSRANISSIYPEATRGMIATNGQAPPLIDNKTHINEAYSFSNGYSIGGSIFWYQLIAGFVLELILFGINYSVLKTATVSVIAIISLLYYLVEFFVGAYIPYHILKSNNIEEPFWLTSFGFAVQSIIIAILFELVITLIIRSVISHGVPSSLAHVGGAGLGVIAVIVYIGFFIASYFLTKLSWGIAFSLFGKIKNKTIVKTIGIGVIAIFIGGIAYHYLTLYSSKLGSSEPKVNVSQQGLNSSAFTEPVTGYQITLPARWTGGELPVDTINGQKTTFASWYYQNDFMDDLRINTASPSSGSIQSDVQNWQSTQQTSNSDYKLISSNATTVNGIPTYYITDSWTTKTLQPQSITDQVLIEDYNGTEYTIDGNSYTQYASSFSGVLKQSLQSFKP